MENIKKINATIKYTIDVYYDDETKQYVGICNEFDYTGMGDTEQEAAYNTDKAVKLALEWCSQNNTIKDVLEEAGYRIVCIEKQPTWEHKPFVANYKKEQALPV